MDIAVLLQDKPDIFVANMSVNIRYFTSYEDLKHVYIYPKNKSCNRSGIYVMTPHAMAISESYRVYIDIDEGKTQFELFGHIYPPDGMLFFDKMIDAEHGLTLWDIVEKVRKIETLERQKLVRLTRRTSRHKSYTFTARPIAVTENSRLNISVTFHNQDGIVFDEPEIVYEVDNSFYTLILKVWPFSAKIKDAVKSNRSVQLLLKNEDPVPD